MLANAIPLDLTPAAIQANVGSGLSLLIGALNTQFASVRVFIMSLTAQMQDFMQAAHSSHRSVRCKQLLVAVRVPHGDLSALKGVHACMHVYVRIGACVSHVPYSANDHVMRAAHSVQHRGLISAKQRKRAPSA